MRLGTAALTLTVALGFAGLATAEESGNWFTRLFTPTAEKTEPEKKTEPDKKTDAKTEPAKMPVSSASNRRARAEADLNRRREVCLKLIEIANAIGDDDLRRKAEMLDQRAYDLSVAAKNQAPIADQDAKKGGR
jgi:hypothetical protein